jgi:hypothetical protein
MSESIKAVGAIAACHNTTHTANLSYVSQIDPHATFAPKKALNIHAEKGSSNVVIIIMYKERSGNSTWGNGNTQRAQRNTLQSKD